MLAVRSVWNYDTRSGQQSTRTLRADWVDVPDPDPDLPDLARDAVFAQGARRGGAIFARLEGLWHGGGRFYFAATSGGDIGRGQVWEYTPDAGGGGLRLIFESADPAVLNGPDNLCLSPRGKALVVCEDCSAVQHVRGLTIEGTIFDFARNMVPGHERDEFAGATFSPDGETLFINIQRPGITLAIWGDWARGPL
jgi:secreted PhoX family phosphatase